MKDTFYQSAFPTLHLDDSLILREQSLDDTSAFLEYYGNPQVGRYILAKAPSTLTEAMNEIHYCRNLFHQRMGIYWTIARRSDNRMIGAVGIYINQHHNRGEICYDLHIDYWRQGIMSKALKRVMTYAFDCIQLSRLEAVTVKENAASIAILKKNGYEFEGTLKNYRQFENKAHDVELFAITAEQFQLIHKKMTKETETL